MNNNMTCKGLSIRKILILPNCTTKQANYIFLTRGTYFIQEYRKLGNKKKDRRRCTMHIVP